MNRIKSYLLLVSAAFILVPHTSLLAADDEKQKAVLITGASTGIGRNAAETLAKAGYFVYAGARKAEDLEALSEIDNIMGVRLDVTVQEEIDAAVELIASEGRGLWGVVNNAGVNVVGPMIEVEESDIDFLFDVNIYGVYRITKAFAPMIIEARADLAAARGDTAAETELLRSALKAYQSLGATGHSERIASLLTG